MRPPLPEPERLAEIRAQLDAGGPVLGVDVRWLLKQVEELTKRVRMYEEVKS
jgi:hypothetical protein